MARHRNYEHATHLSLNIRGMTPSPTVAVNELSNQLIAEGVPVAKLGLGQSPFPVPAPVVEELRRHAPQKDYLPVKGLRPLREAVADYHRRVSGAECLAEDVIIGPGSKELMFLLQTTYYGELVVPSPAWVSYAPQAQIVGRRVSFIPTDAKRRWRLQPKQLEELCRKDPERPRILVLNYPDNPTGCTYSAEELKRLATVARRYEVMVLSDEIYGELHHRGEHRSIARFYPEGTIISSGLSKWCGAGGWRLGTFTFPHGLRWLLDAMAAVASETYTSTCAPVQFAAVNAFRGGPEIERYLSCARRILGALGPAVVRGLEQSKVRAEPPDGAFYVFADFSAWAKPLRQRGVATSEQLCLKLLREANVAILPGSAFGRPAEELTARLAYVNFDGARALAAAEEMKPDAKVDERFLREYCGPTLEAVAKIGSWLERSAGR